MRLGNYYLLGICLSVLLFYCFIQDTYATENSIDMGTHHLHYYTIGNGSPTIVLDVGIGESYKDWLPLFEKFSQKTQIFCYDRAGYGQSEMGPLPRNCVNTAEDLKKLLDRAGIKGPYLLVGHSLGASNLQVFASKNIKHVAGMILLDPPPLDWIMGKGFPNLSKMAIEETKKFESIAESMKNSNDNEQIKRSTFFYTIASEHGEMFLSGALQLASITSFKNVPMIVIASGKPNPAFGDDAVNFQKFWNDQCKQLATKSSEGKYLLSRESSHHIHRDDPDVVIKAINELLSKSDR